MKGNIKVGGEVPGVIDKSFGAIAEPFQALLVIAAVDGGERPETDLDGAFCQPRQCGDHEERQKQNKVCSKIGTADREISAIADTPGLHTPAGRGLGFRSGALRHREAPDDGPASD
jgi:hypothetical protein